MRSGLSITRQFTLLGMLGVLFTLIAVGLGLKTSYDIAFHARETQLQNLMEAEATTAEGFATLADQGKMTTAQAQAAALAAIGGARYDGGNYFFVYDDSGVVLFHPDKAFIGTNRYNHRDVYGNLDAAPLIDGARAGQPVFIRYYQTKAGGSVPLPKISYAVPVPQWGWAIGSGLYIDDLRTAMIDRMISLGEIFVPLFLGFLAMIYFMRRGVSGLLSGLSTSMEQIGAGELDPQIPGLARGDEMGRMARRVAQFRDDAVEKRALEARAEADRAGAEAERNARDAERATAAAAQSAVVEGLATGLAKLASGDLTFRLDTPFSSDYEQLRSDFNAAIRTLAETIRVITDSVQGIRAGAGEITQASDNLSHRTEQQAATLEETAAALDQITATVRQTAEGARNARSVVATAKTDAERSDAVVRDTVAAMSGIEESAGQIGNIIGVIDEIAFQTNLLALNAGVEAARAGDSGRGFAVVATEVRALAQRSADAAKEIKGLISTSGKQVELGVKLVAQTGEALTRIMAQVGQLNHLVSNIASSAAEQSTGLHEVNVAVNQMDQVTQQNAAMVEQTTAASHSLTQETDQLRSLVMRFQVDRPAATQAARRRLPALTQA